MTFSNAKLTTVENSNESMTAQNRFYRKPHYMYFHKRPNAADDTCWNESIAVEGPTPRPQLKTLWFEVWRLSIGRIWQLLTISLATTKCYCHWMHRDSNSRHCGKGHHETHLVFPLPTETYLIWCKLSATLKNDSRHRHNNNSLYLKESSSSFKPQHLGAEAMSHMNRLTIHCLILQSSLLLVEEKLESI